MRNRLTFAKYYLKAKLRAKRVTHESIRSYLSGRHVVGKEPVRSAAQINSALTDAILSGRPFLAGRFGATELFAIRTFDFCLASRYEEAMAQMQRWSGFFPPTRETIARFKDLMLEHIGDADVMGIWMLPFEDYYLNKYGKEDLLSTYLLDLEPWSAPEAPWSAALAGKRVLVIHPFVETIRAQYEKREQLFPGTSILPEFELLTLKAVQTIAGETDDRFATWFDALDWMYEEAMKRDFDVAIIGCGAYGFPLAAKLKRAGKCAIHLAGATQLLFGIKGKRWEENDAFLYVRKFFNDAWVYPGDADKPKNASAVEGGCYWGNATNDEEK